VPVVVLVSAVNGAGTGGVSSALYQVGGVALRTAVSGRTLTVDVVDPVYQRYPASGVLVRLSRIVGRHLHTVRTVRTGGKAHLTFRGLTRGTYRLNVLGADKRSTGLPSRKVVVS
jgi:5-hydroxyisourate hydrolase-like protein (transthyretin family)